MAEKKKHAYVSADSGESMNTKDIEKKSREIKEAAPVGNARGLRIGAACFWAGAIACEVLGVLAIVGKLRITFMPTMWQLIIFLVLDLILIIVGSQFWKKANHIDPASEKNKVKFWLWNNMGLVVCVFAFVPFIIILLANKNVDKKTKAIASIVAVIALLIGSLFSIDFNPVSAEQKAAAQEAITSVVYWTPYGKVYHTHEDCQALNQTDTLTVGDVEQAIAAGRTRLCSFCAKKDNITGVVTDEVDTGDYEPEEAEIEDTEAEEQEAGE